MAKTVDKKVTVTDVNEYSFSAKGKNAIYIKGITQDNIDEESFKIVGGNLIFKTTDSKTFTVSNYKDVKYIKTDAGKKTTLLDIISKNLVYNTNPITTLSNQKKRLASGTIYNDAFDFHEYAPTDLQDIINNKGITINGGKGSDVITGSKFNDTITGGAGTNTINISVKSDKKFGNDTVVLTKGENLRLMLDVDKDDLGYTYNNQLAEHLWVKDSGNDAIIEVYTGRNGYDENDVWGPKGELVGTITIKNYFKKDVLTNSGSFILVDKNENLVTNLRYDRLWKDVYMDSQSGHYNKQSYTGGWSNDYVDAEGFKLYKNGKKTTTDSSKGEEITTETAGYEKVKGVTIKLGGSVNQNEAYGSKYADTIIGGVNDDYIYAGKGNDKITGGKGNNYIDYFFGDGNDTITLTKNEKLHLYMFNKSGNFVNLDEIDFEYANKNKDLIIYSLDDEGKRAGSVTLKNFGKKDVVGSNGTISMDIEINGVRVEVDLKTGKYYNGRANIYETITSKNFTGTWLADYIDARDAELTKTIGKGKKKQTVAKEETDKGLTLKGGAGNDIIHGTKYSDKLYGGSESDKVYGGKGNDKIYGDAGNDFLYGEDGNDTIKGGKGNDIIDGGKGNDKLYGDKGNNEFVFHTNDGVDTIYSGKGVDSIRLKDIPTLAVLDTEIVKNDLKIYYQGEKNKDTATIIIKDYFKKNKKGKYTTSIKNIYIGDSTEPINMDHAIYMSKNKDEVGDAFYHPNTTDSLTVNSENANLTKIKYVATGSGSDNINLDGASNSLYIDAGSGNNTISANSNMNHQIYTGDGNQIITTGSGNDKIEIGDGNHNINAGLGANTITAGDNTSTENKGVISTGYNDDTITVGDGGYEIYTTSGNNIITAGDGNNVISENPENSYGVGTNTITTGSGDDNIYIKGYGEGTTINAGDGDNIIHYDDYGTNTGINNGPAKITTGSGDDSITIGGYYKDTTNWACGTTNNTVNAGDGNNTVTIGHTSTHDNTVETGSGNDTITTFGYNNTITAGDGVNTVTIEGNNAYGNKVTTGSGDDTITLGNGSNTEDEEYLNIIKAGDGANVITTGYGTFDITVGDSTITDTEDPNYNKGSEITINSSGYRNENSKIAAGSGDDTLNFNAYVVSNAEINMGDGNNDITVTSDAINNSQIVAGDGNNTVTIGRTNNVNYTNTIKLGNAAEDGQNTITTGIGKLDIETGDGKAVVTIASEDNTASGYTQKVKTGNGDDEIHIYGYGEKSDINAGAGNNSIHYYDGVNNTAQYDPNDNNGAKFTTGDGNDNITIGNFNEEGNATGSVWNNTINAGAGNNNITIAYGNYNTITTGDDDDTISIGEHANNYSNYNTITAGDGDNTVIVTGNSSYGSKVTTGSGDDTITLGNGSNTEDEEYWNIIEAGDGANVITGGYGTFDITVGDSTITDTEDPNYNKGSEITLGRNGSYNEYTTITAGSGDDTVEFKGYLYNSEIKLGEGDNTMIARSETGHTNISTGSGDDTLSLEGRFYGEDKDNRSKIDLGSGKNTVTTEYIYNTDITTTGDEKQTLTVGDMGDYVNISTGTGDDVINVSSYGENSTITSTGGNNKITYADNMNGWGYSSHGENYHYGAITTGSGNDEITIGTFDEEGNTLGGSGGIIINAGDGQNVIKVAEQCSGNEITTGKDKDIIIIGAKTECNVINAGDGNNEISFGEDGNIYGSNTITTGSGDDIIKVGDANYSSGNKINAGSGANTITTGWAYHGIKIKTEGDEVQNITVGKEDERSSNVKITTGGGADNITILGDADGANITSSGGDNKIEILYTDTYDAKITTGAGDDEINVGVHNSKIYAGAGDNTIVATNTGNTIETGGGKDNITLGDDEGKWANNTVNIGHAERDVQGDWNDEIEDYDYIHEQALEGGTENTVLIKNQSSNEINIYNTQTVADTYNTVTVEGTKGNHTINITGGHAKVDLGTTTENTVTTGSGDDIITAAGGSNTINAGAGDNNITVSGKSNEINTASGKDTIIYTGSGAWDNAEINIGHEERDVFDHWEGDNKIYRHEQAVEGGVENTVNLSDVYNANVNIYNTSIEEGKYNTINVTGASERVYINVSDGHTKVNFNTNLNQGNSNEITTGSGDDEITGFLSSTIDAGDGDNTVTMREYQNGYSSNITTGSGKDKIDVYDYAYIKTGAGDDIINAHVVDSENYGGDDPENRGNYNITASMGAGNDVLNIDEGFKGGLYLNLKLGDGGSNTINGITDSISSIYIDIDPNCEYYVRPSASDNTDLEIVLIENGAETGDVMTLKGVLKNQADHEPIIDAIYINGSDIGGIVSHWNVELEDYEYYWEYYVPTSNDFIINGNHSMSGEISGTEGDDVIYGSDYDDIIKPLYGDDVIRPGKGNDIIDLESKSGSKSIHFNIGDGNLTIKNTSSYSVELYMEGVESGDFTIEKRGKDYCIVRSNGETLTFKDLYEDDGYMGYYNAYIYNKDGEEYTYIGAFASDSKIDKPIHIYAPEDAEGYELVEDYYSKNIFHVSDNVTSIVTTGDSDTVIYGMPYEEGQGGTQVKMDWSSSAKFSRYVREGDNLLIKTVINEDYFYTNEDALWADWNMRTTTIVDFFKEHNKVDYFIFGDRGLTYDSIVAEAMTQAVNKTIDDGETLTKPQDDDWWMGSYTYNAGDGNDTIIATGNADIAYGNGGDDDIYMYNPDNLEEYGASGLFDGGEGNDTYYVKFAPSGTHTIIADKGQDSLVVANAKDTYGGINFDVNDTSTYEMTTDGKDIVLTSNDYYIDNEFVIKDALFKKIDLTISDTVNSLSLKDMMEDNNIYVSSYQTDPESLYASMGNDIIYAQEDCSNVYGYVGSDTIYAFGDKTVYTLGGDTPGSNGFKDTQIGTVDRVELYGMHNTVYAQSETNIINSYNDDSYWENSVFVENTDDYFAHLDQSTTIYDAYGNDSLTIMNTFLTEDGQYEIGGMQNLYIMCDFGDNYSGDYDLLLFNNENLLKWQNGNDMDEDSSNDPRGIRIKSYSSTYNKIETITTADGYTITSEQISELADSISSWMYYGNDGNQYFGSMDGLRTAEHQSDMNVLVQYVQEQAATMWTQA